MRNLDVFSFDYFIFFLKVMGQLGPVFELLVHLGGFVTVNLLCNCFITIFCSWLFCDVCFVLLFVFLEIWIDLLLFSVDLGEVISVPRLYSIYVLRATL